MRERKSAAVAVGQRRKNKNTDLEETLRRYREKRRANVISCIRPAPRCVANNLQKFQTTRIVLNKN